MSIGNLSEFFTHSLQDIYYAENQNLKILTEMMQQKLDAALFDNLEHHLEETQEQVGRLEKIFRAMGQEPKGTTCQAILGIIDESQELAGEITDEHVRDVAAVASAQAIEHYEIARYGTLVAVAECLGNQIVTDQSQLGSLEIVDLLQLSLDEEKNQDARLTALAVSRVNRTAAAA